MFPEMPSKQFLLEACHRSRMLMFCVLFKGGYLNFIPRNAANLAIASVKLVVPSTAIKNVQQCVCLQIMSLRTRETE